MVLFHLCLYLGNDNIESNILRFKVWGDWVAGFGNHLWVRWEGSIWHLGGARDSKDRVQKQKGRGCGADREDKKQPALPVRSAIMWVFFAKDVFFLFFSYPIINFFGFASSFIKTMSVLCIVFVLVCWPFLCQEFGFLHAWCSGWGRGGQGWKGRQRKRLKWVAAWLGGLALLTVYLYEFLLSVG